MFAYQKVVALCYSLSVKRSFFSTKINVFLFFIFIHVLARYGFPAWEALFIDFFAYLHRHGFVEVYKVQIIGEWRHRVEDDM